MTNTRFIPTWDELKEAKKVKIFRKFNKEDSETVLTALLRRIFLYAIKNGERVALPEEWKRCEYISKEQYEEWYYTYARKFHRIEYHEAVRTFSKKSTLNPQAWKFILEGEEED